MTDNEDISEEVNSAIEKTISDTIKTKDTISKTVSNVDSVTSSFSAELYTGPCKVCGHKITGGKIVDGKTSCPVCTTDN